MKRIWGWLSDRLFVSAAASAAPLALPSVRPSLKLDTPQVFTIADVDALRFA